MRSRNDAPFWVRWLLLLAALGFVAVLLILPALNVLVQALLKGPRAYVAAVANPETVHAVVLTSLVALAAVAVNTVFGVAASWAITKYQFPGKSLLVTLLDLPFSVSPVVSGLIYVLSFGVQSKLGSWIGRRR